MSWRAKYRCYHSHPEQGFRLGLKLRNIQFLQISTSYYSNTARASFFRLEYALFLNTAVYHPNQDPVCPSESSIFLKISKYYPETWSKVSFKDTQYVSLRKKKKKKNHYSCATLVSSLAWVRSSAWKAKSSVSVSLAKKQFREFSQLKKSSCEYRETSCQYVSCKKFKNLNLNFIIQLAV